MKTNTTPNVQETKALLKLKVTKSSKLRGRAALEAIKAKLEQNDKSKP